MIPVLTLLTAMQSPVVLPVERASNVFFVRASINGHGPFWFTVDTGATLTVIDPVTAASAGLTPRAAGRRNVGTSDGETDLATVTGARIDIPGLPAFTPRELYVVPVQGNAPYLGHRIDGVLGTDVLQQYVVDFDYAASRVTVALPGPATASASGVPIQLDGNVLVAPATLVLADESELVTRLLIDTGSSGALTLTTPFVLQHRLADRFSSTRASMSISVNGTALASPVVVATALKLGAAVMPKPNAALSRATEGIFASTDFDGVLGAELLRRFRVVIDYPRGRLMLHPAR